MDYTKCDLKLLACRGTRKGWGGGEFSSSELHFALEEK